MDDYKFLRELDGVVSDVDKERLKAKRQDLNERLEEAAMDLKLLHDKSMDRHRDALAALHAKGDILVSSSKSAGAVEGTRDKPVSNASLEVYITTRRHTEGQTGTNDRPDNGQPAGCRQSVAICHRSRSHCIVTYCIGSFVRAMHTLLRAA